MNIMDMKENNKLFVIDITLGKQLHLPYIHCSYLTGKIIWYWTDIKWIKEVNWKKLMHEGQQLDLT